MSTLKVNTIQDTTGNDALTIDSSGNVTASQGFAPSTQLSHRNLIINGAMQVSQRATSKTGLTGGSGGYYTLDRWAWYENGTTSYAMTMSQDTDAPDGFYKSLKLSTTTAQASLSSDHLGRLRYSFEGQDISSFAWGTSGAKQVTLSFWVKSNKTGDLVWWWHHYASTAQTTSKTFTINTADTWEYKTITFAASSSTPTITNHNLGSYLEFIFAAGTNYTSGTANRDWQNSDNTSRAAGITINLGDSTSNYLNITGVQMEVGTVATPFEHRSFGEYLARCQRYFHVCYVLGSGTQNSASSAFVSTHVPVTMRVTPSISTNSGGWGNINVEPDDTYDVNNVFISHGASDGSSALDDTTSWITTVNTNGTQTVGTGCAIMCDQNNDYFEFDSEL